MRISYFLFSVILFLSFSCRSQNANIPEPKENLSQPSVSGGNHQPYYLGVNDSPYGYYLYTPESYQKSIDKFPLLVFLHGYGERGNSQVNPSELNKILVHGPCKLIKLGTWNPSHEMIVASPQCHGDWWDRNLLKNFIEFLMKTYRVDQSRIYLTGLSMGGYATFDLLNSFGEDSHIAAAVPICGSGVLSESGNKNLAKIPLWVFHGDADNVVKPDYSKTIVPAINALNPKIKAKLTVFPGVGHDSWTMTYSGSGMGKEDPAFDLFTQSIYDWMYQYTK
jgi:predicted peptidase